MSNRSYGPNKTLNYSTESSVDDSSKCFYCENLTDKIAIIEFVPGSAGIIRPVCSNCLTKEK